MERRIAELTIRLVKGDICDRRVDAIVNAANNRLWMGGGVAGAIKRRGGAEVEREAMAQGPVKVGAAVATTAGDLPARRVIHAAVMGQDLSTDAACIRRATESALDLATELQLTSLAFPALGTGVGGFPLEECAQIMRDAVVERAKAGTTLKTVEFVLFDESGFQAFAKVLLESDDGS